LRWRLAPPLPRPLPPLPRPDIVGEWVSTGWEECSAGRGVQENTLVSREPPSNSRTAPEDRATASAPKPGTQWSLGTPQRSVRSCSESARAWLRALLSGLTGIGLAACTASTYLPCGSAGAAATRRVECARGQQTRDLGSFARFPCTSPELHALSPGHPASPEISHISSDLRLAPPALAQSSARVCISGGASQQVPARNATLRSVARTLCATCGSAALALRQQARLCLRTREEQRTV
jgi:hypothetical protein